MKSFNYIGRVIAKIESKALGRSLLEFSPRGDWELIYVSGDVIPVRIEKVEFYRSGVIISGG